MTVTERFWSKVDVRGPNECWLWTAGVGRGGYGMFGADDRTVKAHRFAYEQTHGPIPAGLSIDHLCNVRLCQNPTHMEPVTAAENTRRRWERKPQTHCAQGHPWTPENLVRIPSRRQNRCRTCNRRYYEEWRARRKVNLSAHSESSVSE